MTRKHFKALAEALRQVHADFAVVRAVAKVCEQFNPYFDPRKFYIAAAQIGESGVKR